MEKITLKRFIAHFKEDLRKEKKFCFILGSGASKTSGIPTGYDLVKEWIADLEKSDEEFSSWISERGIDQNDYASHYSEIFDRRFHFSKKDGFAFLEEKMENKEPSCGYSVLAQILAKGRHNVVITTNFDSLTEDALFIYTNKKPLVIGHAALANYISTNSHRPLIIKIHHDLLLSPKNSEGEVSCLDKDFSKNLKDVFKYYTPLVIGYGGNDGSLMNFLGDLEHVEEGIFWFYIEGTEPKKSIVDFVDKAKGHFVPIKGFDDLMIQLGDALELEKLDTAIENIAKNRADRYRKQIEAITNEKTIDNETKKAMTNIADRGQRTWWNYELMARKEEDIERKNEIYLQGLKKFPNSTELMGNYALFIHEIKKDYEEADKLYQKLLELNPEYALSNNNYASFLKNIRNDYEGAEKYYRKALKIEPEHAIINGNFAIFLENVKEDYEEAEKHYKKALDINSDDVDFNGNYAIFLINKRKDYNGADKYFKKALEIYPEHANNNSNYAVFLNNIRKDYDNADKYYRKALEIDPEDAIFNGNYANFLSDIRKDYDGAEKYYRKALEVEPEHSNNNGNYAKHLIIQNKKEDAIKYIIKAFELNKGEREDLELELWFYCYAIFPNDYPESKAKIEDLLARGIRSVGWDLSGVLKVAEKENHPDYPKLVEYAKMISEVPK